MPYTCLRKLTNEYTSKIKQCPFCSDIPTFAEAVVDIIRVKEDKVDNIKEIVIYCEGCGTIGPCADKIVTRKNIKENIDDLVDMWNMREE